MFAGASWPSYDDFLTGVKPQSKDIEEEIEQLVKDVCLTAENNGLNSSNTVFEVQQQNNWLTKEKPIFWNIKDQDLIYKQKTKGLPGIKSGIQTHCSVPWNTVNIDAYGRVFVCDCDGHVPFPVGYLEDFTSFDAVFTSDKAVEIQESINKKEFSFCDVNYCGILTHDGPEKFSVPRGQIKLNIGIDTSCNLKCPSCRERFFFDKNADSKKPWLFKIRDLITSTDKEVLIELVGGDALASLLYKDLLELYLPLENAKFMFRTNGLLIKSRIKLLEQLCEQQKLTKVIVSIDAGTAETYEKLRYGGQWSQLNDNLESLKGLSVSKEGNFIVQSENVSEIPAFKELCSKYGLVPTFNNLEDWGTWDDFSQHAVHLTEHPKHSEYLKYVRSA